jgi:hypothetical protein
MATKVATLAELGLGRVAALEQYLLTYAPGNRGRRVWVWIWVWVWVWI